MSHAFSTSLAGELTQLAMCWRIVRSDGVALGFTAHDVPLVVDGLRYAAAPGMAPSAIAISDGLEVDTMEVDGALSADAITAEDLEAGRFDGARVAVFIVDWRDTGAGQLVLAHGTLGEVRRQTNGSGGSFAAELRGPTAAFEATAIEVFAPECRAQFGDRRCGIDLAGRTISARVVSAADRQILVVAGAGINLDDYLAGRLRVLTGKNAGIDALIADVAGAEIGLFEPLPFDLDAGTRIELREGCDKRLATCTARFANAVNFRGEPHLPGGDVLTRFPGV